MKVHSRSCIGTQQAGPSPASFAHFARVFGAWYLFACTPDAPQQHGARTFVCASPDSRGLLPPLVPAPPGCLQGFAVEGDKTTAGFGQGDECWNVGPRSFRIALSCGPENRLYDAEEPTTCGYTAKMTTPAVCGTSHLGALHAQLAQHEELERLVASQAAKDEL